MVIQQPWICTLNGPQWVDVHLVPDRRGKVFRVPRHQAGSIHISNYSLFSNLVEIIQIWPKYTLEMGIIKSWKSSIRHQSCLTRKCSQCMWIVYKVIKIEKHSFLSLNASTWALKDPLKSSFLLCLATMTHEMK